MCMMKTPKMPDAPPERQAARAPERAAPQGMMGEVNRRRLALASSIFTSPSLGAPMTTRPLGA